MSGIPAFPIISAQPEFDWISTLVCLVRCGNANNIVIPNVGGQLGAEFKVIDTQGIATPATPITIYVTLFAGISSVQITTAGGMLRFTWSGAFFAIG